MEKIYKAKQFEGKIYQKWESSGGFIPKFDSKKKSFSIALPPPNATGQLHLGHATMLAIEDIMVRYHRMKGDPTLWVPGTDHAAIATQNRVEKLIGEEGQTRHTLGRVKFIKRVRKYVADSQGTIRNQMRKMGASVDWTRERYTMDDQLSTAVRYAFFRFYQDGLIYRGHRIVNWCTRCQSTLADDELEYREEKTKFYYLKYGPVVIGTARPETKFLDKIIIVHPKDRRYKKWHGKKMMVPWINGEIEATFISDEVADMQMGSGAMTITPAHSFVDFELAQKYGFEIHQIINESGEITEAGGSDFKGLLVKEAREKIIQELTRKGLVDHIDENYIHNLSVCYRCGTPVEPLVSEQWFINVNKKVRGKSLKQRSIEVVKNGEIKILPDLFNKTYFHWMENLRDWCISRQIWWGHQIPVWYCVTKKKRMCAKPIVALETPKHCPYCLGNKLQQDPDTLDTWFSSGLWTFSTLGWPQRTKDLANFHPTSVLETGYDILFFWVARMILLTTYLLDEIPFKTVYLHGLVRDKQGLKMSKSLGNGIDPLDMIDKYGTDAVRLSLVLGSSPGNDMRLYEEKIAGYRNFVNKIWNGARFVLLNLDKDDFRKKIDYKSLAKIDQWILHRTNEVVKQASKGIEEYRFSEVGLMIYDFFWSEYCDWYVEMSKITQNKAVLAYVLKTVLALLHPFIPFISEKIWELIGEKELLMVSNWPSVNPKNNFPFSKREIKQIIEVVSVIRQSRAEYHLSPAEKIKVTLYGHGLASTLNLNLAIIKQLARVDELVIKEKGEKLKGCLGQFVGNIEVYLHIADLIDISKECERLQKELENVSQYLDRLKKKVTNKQYLRNAPKLIIEQDKHNFDESLSRQKNLVAQLKNLM